MGILIIITIIIVLFIIKIVFTILNKIEEKENKRLQKIFWDKISEKDEKRKQLGVVRPTTSPNNFPILKLTQAMNVRAARPTLSSGVKIGYSEKLFYSFLIKYFDSHKIFWNNKEIDKKRPDFIYQDSNNDVNIVIEIDEPYIYESGESIHYIGHEGDEDKNELYLHAGWTLIRFSEFQIIKYPNECCKFLGEVIDYFNLNYSYKNSVHFKGIQSLPNDKCWTELESKIMAKEDRRNNYHLAENKNNNEQIFDTLPSKLITSEDLKQGICKTYYENGIIESEAYYIDDKINGIKKTFYESGRIKSEFPYTENRRDGVLKTFYEKGTLKSETFFANDQFKGRAMAYYENGALEKEFRPDNNGNGSMKYYYESGALKVEAQYANYKQNGIFKRYYENGTIKIEMSSIDGIANGVEKKYYGNGVLKEEKTFINGDKQGIQKTYFESGALELETPYIENKKNGTQKLYNEIGELLKITIYLDDVEIELTETDNEK